MEIIKEYRKIQWKEKKYQEFKRRKDSYTYTKERNNRQQEDGD